MPVSTDDNSRTVAVCDGKPWLTFHSPDELASSVGVETVTEHEARAAGALPCQRCYAVPNPGMYYFPYMNDDR